MYLGVMQKVVSVGESQVEKKKSWRRENRVGKRSKSKKSQKKLWKNELKKNKKKKQRLRDREKGRKSAMCTWPEDEEKEFMEKESFDLYPQPKNSDCGNSIFPRSFSFYSFFFFTSHHLT